MTQREAQILQWIQENPLISQQELADRAGITRSSVAVHISNLMKKGYIDGKGYIIRTAPYAVVVGGVNMDIGGTPYAPLVGQDSNPGRVRMSLGGVGRNIAHNMALLGLDVRMITALGDDMNAQKITTSCIELGIDLGPSLQVPGGTTSTYLFITNDKGDMELAVSDMESYDHLTPRFLATKEQLLNNALAVEETQRHGLVIPGHIAHGAGKHARHGLALLRRAGVLAAEEQRADLIQLHVCGAVLDVVLDGLQQARDK